MERKTTLCQGKPIAFFFFCCLSFLLGLLFQGTELELMSVSQREIASE